MTLQDAFFIGIAGITLLGALLAVSLKNVFYNALGLILCLFGVAGVFLFLNSEFLAVIEVTVYIGAIAVAIIFAIMLSRPMFQKNEPRDPGSILRALIAAALLFAGLVEIIRRTAWTVMGTSGDYSLKAIGNTLLSSQALAFEVISLVLLVAILGALLLSQSKDKLS